jgi:DNA polymerase
MMRREPLAPAYGKRVTDVLKLMLRPALVPAHGHVFVVADWSAIEGRVNPWLAASATGEAKLDVFRRRADPYKVNAATTYGVQYSDVTDDQRQVGKVQELALGFGGGAGAFEAMARGYGVRLPADQVERSVRGWRHANPWAPVFWSDLERAYWSAMRHPGAEFDAGRVTYLYDNQTLWYVLPSGRVLGYPYARIEGDEISYAKASWKPAADAKEWPRARLWRGLACENVTQAAAHDVLRGALRVLDGVVAHVHDEIVLEVPEAEAEEAKAMLERVMTTAPDWAAGLPLAVEAKIMRRYGK